MDWFSPSRPFAEAVKTAFPPYREKIASKAASDLQPFLDHTYRTTSQEFVVDGSRVHVPYRLHFTDGVATRIDYVGPVAHCLLTRSTDGYLRQRANRAILALNDPWAIPFVVMLLGEYVLEIADDIHSEVTRLDRSAYSKFVLQNREAMRILKARATSYWNCYHRWSYPDRRTYPALAALTNFEEWAS
ncbi:hypothetical protein [Aquibium oceanicum]|uniref:Uncharacterized protein n=1 Tax=Aquibium oceanicum TaxID=1670800 RepID=A0A1L3SNX0_9HYPH|nr:hypothetical protein [Aquibium oceanicum]APH71012.1 hypothetical protein BSQ44_06205 [Aquibium oceanicum]